jgi:phage terminase large subunit-like protein
LSDEWKTHPAGDLAVNFIQHLKLVDDYFGDPVILRGWQEKIIRQIYGTINPKTGKRQYKKVFIFLPRKSCKTLLASWFVNLGLFCGPPGTSIYSAASSREQAAKVFEYCEKTIIQSRRLSTLCNPRTDIVPSKKSIRIPRKQSVYVALSSDGQSAHSLSPSLVVADELHTWSNNKGRKLWEALKTGSGARKEPLFITITTAGWDRHSLCYEEYEYAKAVQKDPSIDPEYLPIIFELPEQLDWRDEKNWHIAMPALGDYVSLDYIKSEFCEARQIPARQAAFRQLFLNQWCNQDHAWLPYDKWLNLKQDFTEEDLAGKVCIAALDLSRTIDLTALVLLFPMEDGTYRTLTYSWLPEAQLQSNPLYEGFKRAGDLIICPGSVIDYEMVRAKIDELAKKFKIKVIGIDPWAASETAEIIRKSGHNVLTVNQTLANLSPACKYLEALILDDKIFHNGNKTMNFCVNNVIVRRDRNDNFAPDKSASKDKIDCVSALVTALALKIGTKAESPYEKHGLRTI